MTELLELVRQIIVQKKHMTPKKNKNGTGSHSLGRETKKRNMIHVTQNKDIDNAKRHRSPLYRDFRSSYVKHGPSFGDSDSRYVKHALSFGDAGF